MGEILGWVWNGHERRPRAAIRLAVFGLLVIALQVAIARLGSRLGLFGPSLEGMEIFYAALATGVLALAAGAARVLDRRPAADLGLGPRPGYALDLAAGVTIGAGCIGLVALLEAATGLASYVGRSWEGPGAAERLLALRQVVVIFACVALVEELVFRAYAIVNLAEGLAARAGSPRRAAGLATLGTSIAFGVAHAGNPSGTAVSIAFIMAGGVFLAVGLLFRGDLALPLGVHFGWNLGQALLDMPVSGQPAFTAAAVVVRFPSGSDALTGGPFGPEAGLTGLAAMLLGTALTLAWVRVRVGSLAVAARLGVPPRERAGSPTTPDGPPPP